MKKNMKKRNNKGFSLVELIVVVLIMAIIAVALAPQVMKWVENSRQSNDAQLRDAVVSAFQVASTDKDVYGKAVQVVITNGSATWTFTGNDPALSDAQQTAVKGKINAIFDVTNARCKSTATTLTISLSKDGKVTSTAAGFSGDLEVSAS